MTDDDLHKIIRPLTEPVYSVSVFWRHLDRTLDGLDADYGGLDHKAPESEA
ncbi:hypothetical protein [Acidiphilium sp. C61]|uniref:hypothetical protein n=1 Tax=Acidiphilium sp. C61 TaxID=1671485 RepID=UPI00157A75B5|nr:hypothetical protein [Acidiphilium sp. C61]